ncbi:MAG TPA: ABC transporter ATP-binding protein [Deltaproteobacteria bacterium]|nr:MAG: ABC transporter ATP-binding protein [Deltaproteobacteria bacterium]RLB38103.1 MAG: ABC transporter ATP-binding protein [Deltaproteobacteria bacterium]HDM77646.1 ABC transporter ATP-binding protein [Deltaproteobacteria bacterium]
MTLLETKGLTKAFGALVAVSEVDLTVEKGVIHSIIGPNGAGKTTLFNLLSGVYPPTSGAIRFQGRDITSLKLFKRSRIGIGRSFQITSIFPELTVRENVWLAVQSRGKKNFSMLRKATDMKKVEEKTAAILEEMQLKEFEGYKAGTIPYGSQRSLDMAIALATEPILLLLDEPTSGMTPEDTHKMIALIKKVSERYTIILIEHHMNVVMSISDRITVLHQGRIIAEGNPEFIKENEEVRRAYLGGLKR